MKNNSLPARIPTPLGFLALFLILAGGIFVLEKKFSFSLRASSEATPTQVRITNVGSAGFVVSWLTKENTSGIISLGETTGKLNELRKDVRDLNRSDLGQFKTHYVLADNLKPEIKYYFKIVSGGKSFDNSGKLFEISTAAFKTPPDNDIAQGEVIDAQGQPVAGALVYFSLANTSVQSAITDTGGNWLIPLAMARTPDLKGFSQYDRSAQIAEILVNSESETATATLTTGNDNPSPNIVLGQNHNFLGQVPQATPTIVLTQNENRSPTPTSGFGAGGTTQTFSSEKELTISYPSEKEAVNSLLPAFLGSGPKGQKLQIKVESAEKIDGQTNIDTKGEWNWSPSQPLSPGEHTITVSYTDTTGFLRKVTRSFTVLAVGSSDLPSFTATASGQKTSPTPTTIIGPTVTPTSVPTISSSPTATPTSVSRTSVPAGTESAPASGNDWPTRILFGAGAVSLLLALVLVIL